ncbi:MAG: ATP-binding protein [Spirosomataceae bacterium]
MNIRLRLTILFAVLVASIMLVFSLSVYYLYDQYREQEFNKRLREKALTTVRLLEDVGGITKELLHAIDRNNLTAMFKEEVTIYNDRYQIIYDSGKEPYPIKSELLVQVKEGQDFFLRNGDKEIVGVRYIDKRQQTMVVVAYAIDIYGFSKLDRLRYILIIGWTGSLLLVLLAGWFFAGDALKPVSDIIEQVKNISARNIHERLKAGRQKDELAQLAATFNDLLERLEDAFKSQRSFVSHASHELRTPLAIMMGQLEVALLQKRTPEAYQETIKEGIEEVKKMRDLVNGLLELARLNDDTSQFNFRSIRIDDLLWQSREMLISLFPQYTIHIEFDQFPEDEASLEILGDAALLQTAFSNLMENGCKYSEDHRNKVTLHIQSQGIRIAFTDDGIGIAEKDLSHIFEPFYRAEATQYLKGHGVGLALTQRIIQLHRGKISVTSQLGKGTQFVITLPF